MPTPFKPLTLPSEPIKDLDNTDHSLLHPSSCDDDVLSFIGQLGHVKSLFSFLGGSESNSNCLTDLAP